MVLKKNCDKVLEKNCYQVGVADCGEAVGDYEHCATDGSVVEGILHYLLQLCIQSTRGLIQHQQSWTSHHGSCNGYPLLFPL